MGKLFTTPALLVAFALAPQWALAQRVPLDGVVLNQAGEPLEHAVVSAVEVRDSGGADLRSALTDKAGRFRLDSDSRLPIRLSVWHSVYSPQVKTVGAGAANVVVRLPEGGTLAGTVKETNGASLANADVRVAYAKDALPFEPSTAPVGGRPRTDATGRFTLKRLMPHVPFRVEIASDGVVRASSRRIVVRPGETLTLELVAREPLTVEGRVVDEDGVPVSDAVVMAWTRPDGRDGFFFQSVPMAQAQTDARGMFRVNSTPGSDVTIRASKTGFRGGSGRVAVSEAATGTVTVQVVLMRQPS